MTLSLGAKRLEGGFKALVLDALSQMGILLTNRIQLLMIILNVTFYGHTIQDGPMPCEIFKSRSELPTARPAGGLSCSFKTRATATAISGALASTFARCFLRLSVYHHRPGSRFASYFQY